MRFDFINTSYSHKIIEHMKNINYLLIILVALFVSCVDTNNDISLKVNIGENQANVILMKYDPPILATSTNPDSIDVDGDLKYDFIFTKTTVPLKTGYGLATQIAKKTGTQIVLSSINNYPDTLSYSSILDDKVNWSDDKNDKLVLQGYSCPQMQTYCVLSGNFIKAKAQYLGFRISKRYGWIKLVNEESGALKIEEFAISK